MSSSYAAFARLMMLGRFIHNPDQKGRLFAPHAAGKGWALMLAAPDLTGERGGLV